MANRKLDPAAEARLCRLFRQNVGVKALSERFGITTGSVQRILDRNGCERPLAVKAKGAA